MNGKEALRSLKNWLDIHSPTKETFREPLETKEFTEFFYQINATPKTLKVLKRL